MNSLSRRLVLAAFSGVALVCSASELGGFSVTTIAPSAVEAEQDLQLALSRVDFQGAPPAAQHGDWQRVFRANWR